MVIFNSYVCLPEGSSKGNHSLPTQLSSAESAGLPGLFGSKDGGLIPLCGRVPIRLANPWMKVDDLIAVLACVGHGPMNWNLLI